jgi:hypothetical protein
MAMYRDSEFETSATGLEGVKANTGVELDCNLRWQTHRYDRPF